MFLAFADRVQFAPLVVSPPRPDTRIRVSLRDVSTMVMPKPDRQKMLRETETLLKIGRPSINRKATIKARVVMEARATKKKKNRIARSFL